MAAIQAREYARRSTTVTLTVPPTIAALSVDDAFAALSRNFIAAWAGLKNHHRARCHHERALRGGGAREDGPRRCRR